MAHERILYIKRHAGFLAGVLVILAMTGIVVTTNRFWQIPSKEVMNMGLPQGFELAMDETDDALWHFIHTSDLHLQVTHPERTEAWRRFLKDTVPLINPVRLFLW